MDYEKIRMGYFLLYQNDGSKFGNLIAKRQAVKYPDPEQHNFTHIETSGGGKHSVNVSPPVSKFIEIDKVHKGRYIKLVRYKNEDYEKRGRYKVAYFSAALTANRAYDFLGILAFIHKWFKQRKGQFFCSEGCATALKKEYPQAFGDLEPSEIVPADFLNEEEFEVVSEGVIE